MKRTINGESYDFVEEAVPLSKLRFWEKNPRIYAEMFSPYEDKAKYSDDQMNEKIYLHLKELSNVRDLRSKIFENGGLIDALMVQKIKGKDVYRVLEGNRRLAACLMIGELSKGKPDAFTIDSVPCEVVSEIPEEVIYAYLGAVHIVGKKDWDPFAKAVYIKHRVAHHGGNLDKLEKELKESKPKISRQLATINLMEYGKEKKTDTYSFYDVVIGNGRSKSALTEPVHKERLVEAIKEYYNDGEAALDFRKDLTDAVKAEKEFLKFLDGKQGLDEAAEKSRKGGNTNSVAKKIRDFRKWLDSGSRLDRICKLGPTDPVFKNIAFDIGKIKKTSKDWDDKLKKTKNA